jgi:ankyrin repeat protein
MSENADNSNKVEITELKEMIENCQFDEFKNAVQAGTIDVNYKWPSYHGMPNAAFTFAYLNSLDLENKIKWVTLFASFGADVNNELWSLIRHQGEAVLIKTFVELGADIHKRNEHGRTLMFEAVWGDRVEHIKCLAELGADVNARDNDGRTPIFYTIERQDIDTMQCLAELGADLNAIANDESMPLSHAKGYTKAVKWLKANGAK